jgi:2-polyprenyl-6-hydroxyphenyl methylase/3-demethylubiquinone-9 3-methyltransferase
VLDLGCGYGRAFPALSQKAKTVIGADNSLENLIYGKEEIGKLSNCLFVCCDATNLSFPDKTFDKVICIQNGISAFGMDPKMLIRESLRTTKPGGKIFFSTYSDRFWDDRLEWFKIQSKAGLIGEIDNDKTGDGVIVCIDGFQATTISADDLGRLAHGLNVDIEISEVDRSSLFSEIVKR